MCLGDALCDPASQTSAPSEPNDTCGAVPLASPTTRLPELLTFQEVRELLRVSRNTLYQLSHAGKIPGAYKLGKVWRYPRAPLEDWLCGRTPGLARARQAKRWG